MAPLLWLVGGPLFTAATWDFHGELPRWVPDFPDLDCLGSSVWDDMRQQVESSQPEKWADAIWARFDLLDFGGAREIVQDLRKPECHLGVLFVAVVLYGACLGEAAQPCAEEEPLSELAQGLLRMISVETLLGTRWPLLAALDGLKLAPYADSAELSCRGVQNPIIDWGALQDAFAPGGDWFVDGRRLVYGRAFQANWLSALDECTYGFAMVALWKMVICAETQAECVSQYSILVDDMVKHNDWREVVGNPWPMFGFLARVQKGVTRHGYKLDFTVSELQGQLPASLRARPLVGIDAGSAAAAGAARDEVSESYADVVDTVLSGLPKAYLAAALSGAPEVRHLLYITMVFGPRYVPYIPRFVARAEAVGIPNLALFCLDAAALEVCASLPGGLASGRCIRGTPSILNKFTLPLAFLHLGVDVFWLDFDVFILRDPTQLVLDMAQSRQVDLLVSGSFADDCICSGLVFFRATKVLSDWLLALLSWMYEHVYTHDQQAFSAFLAGRPDEDNATTPERISAQKHFRLYLKPEVPRWALLDPVVEFPSARVLNTTGWMGNLEDMYIFHFLHGDSEVNRAHSAYGWNAASGYSGGAVGGRAVLDIFYGQKDDRVYSEAGVPSYERCPELRDALLASRRPERPAEMLHCGVLQLNEYSPGRMSADG